MKTSDDNQPVTYGLLKSTLKQAFADFGSQFGREMRDYVRQEISASEIRIKKEVTQKITEGTAEILDGVGQILDHSIHPQLDNHEHRILKLETQA